MSGFHGLECFLEPDHESFAGPKAHETSISSAARLIVRRMADWIDVVF
jgi:hypothetical protein